MTIYHIIKNTCGRWIIVNGRDCDLAWSGSCWVEHSDGFGIGRAQVSSFSTKQDAEEAAHEQIGYAVLCPDGEETGVLIRKEKHGLPFLPFFSANFWNIPRAGYGLGIGRISGSSQRVEKGLNDAMLDILSFVSGKAK
jgi:hypothetical protein